jgi:hypothetical protein
VASGEWGGRRVASGEWEETSKEGLVVREDVTGVNGFLIFFFLIYLSLVSCFFFCLLYLVSFSYQISLKLSPSNNPLSLNFKCGITSKAIKDNVINGDDNVEPNSSLLMISMAV